MKVLIVNLDKAVFRPLSPNRDRLVDYASFLEKLWVIVWTIKKEKRLVINERLTIWPTNSGWRGGYFFDTFWLARQILRDNKIDLIVAQDAFEVGLVSWLLAIRYKIPVQLQLHVDFLSQYFWRAGIVNKLRVLLAKFLLPRADGVRVVSRRIKDSLMVQKIKLKKEAVVLPIFVDVVKIKKTLPKIDLRQKYPQFDFLMLVAARLSPEKNISLTIEAMAEIVKDYPRAGLIIVGDGPERKKLIKLITQRKLGEQIKLEGWADDLSSYYKTADLFLLTSNYEGWGLAPLEALAAGCPVVMTDVGCVGEVVKNNVNGLVVPVGDKQALIAAIKKIMGNKELRRRLATEGLETAKVLSNKEQYLADYQKSWQEIIFQAKNQ